MCGLFSVSALGSARCGAQEKAEATAAQTVTANSVSPSSDDENSVGFSAVQNFVNDQKGDLDEPVPSETRGRGLAASARCSCGRAICDGHGIREAPFEFADAD